MLRLHNESGVYMKKIKKIKAIKLQEIFAVEWPNGNMDFFHTMEEAVRYSDINTIKITRFREAPYELQKLRNTDGMGR